MEVKLCRTPFAFHKNSIAFSNASLEWFFRIVIDDGSSFHDCQ